MSAVRIPGSLIERQTDVQQLQSTSGQMMAFGGELLDNGGANGHFVWLFSLLRRHFATLTLAC